MASSDEVIEPQPAKISRVWVMLAVLLAMASVGVLWLWQHRRPPVSGVCNANDLTLSIGREEDKTVTTYVRVVLTNKGSRTCTLKGYPVVSVLDTKGENRVTGDALWDEQYKPRTVVIGPSEQAHALVAFPNPNGFPDGACLTNATTLRLYLPADAIIPGMVPLTVHSTRSACPGLSVTSLQAGS